MTVAEMFADALENGNSYIAHALFSGLSTGRIHADDLATADTFDRIDAKHVEQLHQQNALGIKPIELYAVPLKKKEFAMYFAQDLETVKRLHREQFKSDCSKIHNMTRGMDMSMYSLDTKQHETWRQIKDGLAQLPAFVCILQK